MTLAVISPLLPLLTHHIGTGMPPWDVSFVMRSTAHGRSSSLSSPQPTQYYSRLTPSSAAANAPWVHSVIDTLLPTSVLLPRADRRTCPVHSQHHIGTGMPPCDVFSVTLAVISPLLPLLTHHIGTGVPPWGVSSVTLAVISPTSLIQHIVANVSRCCLDLRSLLPVRCDPASTSLPKSTAAVLTCGHFYKSDLIRPAHRCLRQSLLS